MEDNNNSRHSISLYVWNKPSVLARIALCITRRGFNIDSLVVSQARNPDFSWMNIEANGAELELQLLFNQLNKLIDVVHIKGYKSNEDNHIIHRELALFKLSYNSKISSDLLVIANTFGCKTIDISKNTITFQVTGSSDKIEQLKKIFDTYAILELVRSGKLLIARGDTTTA